MARWHLTSSITADQEARRICEGAHLRSSGEYHESNFYLRTYFKRVVGTANLVQHDNDDWICCAGTLIFNGKLGEEALKAAYAAYLEGGIERMRSSAIGHYAVAIRRGNQISVFTDPQGALNLFYSDNGSSWFISNSLSLCAGVLSRRRIDATKLLITVLQTSLPGEETFYPEIKRLFGTQAIRIDLDSAGLRVERVPEPNSPLSWGLSSIEDAVEQYKLEVRSVFRELIAVGNDIGLFGTGGRDSRTVLAGLLDQGATGRMMYGVGNSRLTDSNEQDLMLARTVAHRSDVPFQQLDWSGSQPHNEKTLQDLFRRYGFRYEIYGASQGFLRMFEGGISPYPDLFLGGYSPAFTKMRPWEGEQSSFSFDELVTDGMSFQGGTVDESECIVDKAEYRAVYAMEIRKALQLAGIDYPEAGASLETFVAAKLFLILRAEARFLNYANEFGHYIAPFLMKRLCDPLFRVPLRYRSKDEFQMRLIRALAPGLIEVPIISGTLSARIDQQKLQFVGDHGNRRGSFAGRLVKKTVPVKVYEPLRRFLSPAYEKQAESKTVDSSVVEAYSRLMMSHPLGQRWFRCTTELTPKDLARVCHYLVGVETLGYVE